MKAFDAHVWTVAAILTTAFVLYAYAQYKVSVLNSLGKRSHIAAKSAAGMITALTFMMLFGYILVRGFANDGGSLSEEAFIGIIVFMVLITTSALVDPLSAKTEDEPHTVRTTVVVDEDPDPAMPGDHEGIAAIKRIRSGPDGIKVDLVVEGDAKIVLKGRLADDFLKHMAAGDWPEDRDCSFTVGDDGEVVSFSVTFD